MHAGFITELTPVQIQSELSSWASKFCKMNTSWRFSTLLAGSLDKTSWQISLDHSKLSQAVIKVLLFGRNFAYSVRKIDNHFLTSSPQCSLVNAHGGSLLEFVNEVDCGSSHTNGPTLDNTAVTHPTGSNPLWASSFSFFYYCPLPYTPCQCSWRLSAGSC